MFRQAGISAVKDCASSLTTTSSSPAAPKITLQAEGPPQSRQHRDRRTATIDVNPALEFRSTYAEPFLPTASIRAVHTAPIPIFISNPYEPCFESSTARSIRGLRDSIETENMRRRQIEREQQRIQAKLDLNAHRDPRSNEIRGWVRESLSSANLRPLPNHPDLFLSFAHAKKPHAWSKTNNDFNIFPRTALAFWYGINDCVSEAQTRRYIKFVQQNLEDIILQSSLPKQDKQKFLEVLNVEEQKNPAHIFAVMLGLSMFIILFPICIALASQTLVVECAATALLCATLTFGPYWFVENFLPAARIFPENRGPICELPSFQKWLQDLAMVAENIDPVASNSTMALGSEIPTAYPVDYDSQSTPASANSCQADYY